MPPRDTGYYRTPASAFWPTKRYYNLKVILRWEVSDFSWIEQFSCGHRPSSLIETTRALFLVGTTDYTYPFTILSTIAKITEVQGTVPLLSCLTLFFITSVVRSFQRCKFFPLLVSVHLLNKHGIDLFLPIHDYLFSGLRVNSFITLGLPLDCVSKSSFIFGSLHFHLSHHVKGGFHPPPVGYRFPLILKCI